MTETRVRISNPRNQPVELHCDGDTLVLAPFASCEIDARIAGAPQVATLERNRLLAIEPLVEPHAEPPPIAKAKAKAKPAPAVRKTSRKTSRAKGKTHQTAAPKKPAARKKSR